MTYITLPEDIISKQHTENKVSYDKRYDPRNRAPKLYGYSCRYQFTRVSPDYLYCRILLTINDDFVGRYTRKEIIQKFETKTKVIFSAMKRAGLICYKYGKPVELTDLGKEYVKFIKQNFLNF